MGTTGKSRTGFESFVNSEECKTSILMDTLLKGLRALLIQKSVKQIHSNYWSFHCLRALLIQKSVKQVVVILKAYVSLRALLIQKSVKHGST